MENNNNTLVQDLSSPIFMAKGWMKLVGVLMIIYGVLVALSIVGIIIAWLPIWMGVLLFQSASQVEQAYQSGDQMALHTSLSKLKTYFTIMGVLSLLGLLAFVLSFVFGIGAAIMGGVSTL
ncbi:MAG: DUF5362 domain-containing protein [Granulosicoccaceae bacterium]|jgi:hypothetical protein